MDSMLQIANLSMHFGGVKALDDVSFEVGPGEICGLIGPNGAGKTTLFNCLSRLYSADSGTIRFEGRDLLSVPAHGIAALGVSRTFQNLALFKSMTVLDNIKVGAASRTRTGFLAHTLALPLVAREEREIDNFARHVIGEVGLESETYRPIAQLNFAAQKLVELARALVSQPKLLLLDEPAGGLNHEEVTALGDLIRRLQKRLRISVLLVEHHLNLVMRISDKVVALNFGRKIADGPPTAVQGNVDVIQAYLGPHRDDSRNGNAAASGVQWDRERRDIRGTWSRACHRLSIDPSHQLRPGRACSFLDVLGVVANPDSTFPTGQPFSSVSSPHSYSRR